MLEGPPPGDPPGADRWTAAVPDEADVAAVVCLSNELVAPVGPGVSPGDQHRYTRGDQLPVAVGVATLEAYPERLVAFDAAGEYVAGAVGHPQSTIKTAAASLDGVG